MESLINPAAHLRRIFSRLLPVEKPAVRQVLPVFFAVAYEKICTGSAPPHLIIASFEGCEAGRGNESVSGGDREPRLPEPQRDSSAAGGDEV